MKKYTIKTALQTGQKSKEWPVVVFLWSGGLALVGYITGRIALSTMPHPYHWLSLLIGLVLGIPVGWLWFRWRGDIKI
jgi:hypothetical protein